jgi:membrane fusion protein (multidrug efflux system)
MAISSVFTTTQKVTRGLLLVLLVAGLGTVGFRHWLESSHWEETDNAYLDGPVHSIASRVIGTVQEVLVEENARVKQGQVLIGLDARDQQNLRAKADAKITEAKASLTAAQTNAALAEAKSRLDEITLEKCRHDLERLDGLSTGGRSAVSRQELEHAQSAFDTASASLDASRSAIDVAKAQIDVVKAQQVSAGVALELALLQCEYTIITAPVDGRVGRRSVETGQPVIPAQPLVAVVADDLWLKANFKETQIARIKPGQAAVIRFDSLPGREWPGTVESLSPASGSRFALLPPDNATGNFTRVVQRLQVRIRLDPSARAELGSCLAPGLSAEVKVRVDPVSNEEPAGSAPSKLTLR